MFRSYNRTSGNGGAEVVVVASTNIFGTEKVGQCQPQQHPISECSVTYGTPCVVYDQFQNYCTRFFTGSNLIPVHRYFIGIPPMRPGQRHLYYVSSLLPHVGSSLHPAVCVTCTETTERNRNEHRTTSSNHHSIWPDNTYIHDHYETQTENEQNEDQTKENVTRKQKSKADIPPSKYKVLFDPFNVIIINKILLPIFRIH